MSETWASWVKKCPGDGFKLTLTFVKETCLGDLKKHGLVVPSWNKAEAELTAGLEAQAADPREPRVGIGHMFNMLWQPINKHLGELAAGDDPSWTEALGRNQQILTQEMTGTVASPSEALTFDEWVEFIQKTLVRMLGVHVPEVLISSVVRSFAHFDWECTRANALLLLRSSVAKDLVGPTMATQLGRKILAEIAEVPVTLLSEDALSRGCKQDLVDSLRRRHCQADEAGDASPLRKRLRRSRTAAATKENLASNTEAVLFAIRSRTPTANVQNTLSLASEFFQRGDGDLECVGETALSRRLLLLDGALDRCTADALFDKRERGTFAGVALATDESPPSQPRFRGLRFQITNLYIGTFLTQDQWERSKDPPIATAKVLGDICHCPGKQGVDVSRVIDKQLARVGLNPYDVVGGVGDGGGENEGIHGIHAHFENLSPGYVRRRCLPHMAWRTGDMAIKASALDYRALAAYLVDGITWNRLKAIATTTRAEGGLGICTEGSRAYKNLFHTAPSAIIETRPDSDLKLLKFLNGKEHILFDLASRDLTQRTALSEKTKKAVENLGDIDKRIHRAVLAELLERCFFLLYWNGKHNHLARETSCEELFDKGSALVLDTDVSGEAVTRLGSTPEEVAAMDPRPKTWVELCVYNVVGDMDLVAARLPGALDFHRAVATKAASHLKLLKDNTLRTPWLAARMLSGNKAAAKAAASELLKHLDTTRPTNRTAFEVHLSETEGLYADLVAFANADPPVLLWHGHCKYEGIFRFLAPRFLLAPDHVLDCERTHAKWQWACAKARAMKLPKLNALLRMTAYVQGNLAFPSHEALEPHLQAERHWHRETLAELDEADEVAPGYRLLVVGQ